MRPQTDAGRARIPALKREVDGQSENVVENEEKSSLFFNKFFIPPADPAAASIPRRPKYPKPAFKLEAITDRQIDMAVRQLAPYKAPGPNGVPNVVFKKAREVLVPYLGRIFRASVALNHYIEEWKVTRTVVI
ncbi:hypothetical protein SCHPADRAFT_827037, partial [Schizopora paradoxa]